MEDIKAIAAQVIEKVKADPMILGKLKSDPVGTIKELTGKALPNDVVKSVMDMVGSQTEKADVSGMADKMGDFLK